MTTHNLGARATQWLQMRTRTNSFGKASGGPVPLGGSTPFPNSFQFGPVASVHHDANTVAMMRSGLDGTGRSRWSFTGARFEHTNITKEGRP
jgi:hypothetical protein